MSPKRRPISLRRATLLSLALHCCAFALLALAPRTSLGPERLPREVVHTERVTIGSRPAGAVVRPRLAPVTATDAIASPAARVVRPNPHTAVAPRPIVAFAAPLARHAHSEAAIATTTAAADAVPIVTVVSPTATPTAATSPPASPGPTSSVLAETNVPPGGWGQNFSKPLVADDEALANVRASVRGSAIATIDVDETGHALRVSLPTSLPSELRADIEKRLLALPYVPAECNGLRCMGTLQLTL